MLHQTYKTFFKLICQIEVSFEHINVKASSAGSAHKVGFMSFHTKSFGNINILLLWHTSIIILWIVVELHEQLILHRVKIIASLQFNILDQNIQKRFGKAYKYHTQF